MKALLHIIMVALLGAELEHIVLQQNQQQLLVQEQLNHLQLQQQFQTLDI